MKTTYLFFDTEFTGLKQDTDLISIGIVDETGENTFYYECNDFDWNKIDNWIYKNVITKLSYLDIILDNQISIPILTNNYSVCDSFANLRRHLDNWLQLCFNRKPVQFVSDVCHYDFVLLCEIFGGALNLPSNIPAVCIDINSMIASYLGITEKEAFDINREEFAELLKIEAKQGDDETEIKVDVCLRLALLKKHNALFDAEVIRRCWLKINKEG